MRIDNPLLSDIKKRFPLAYSMALDSSAVLAKHYGKELSEDEMGYIALAFALAIERQKTEMAAQEHSGGMRLRPGSARLLEWRYRQEFGSLVGHHPNLRCFSYRQDGFLTYRLRFHHGAY